MQEQGLDGQACMDEEVHTPTEHAEDEVVEEIQLAPGDPIPDGYYGYDEAEGDPAGFQDEVGEHDETAGLDGQAHAEHYVGQQEDVPPHDQWECMVGFVWGGLGGWVSGGMIKRLYRMWGVGVGVGVGVHISLYIECRGIICKDWP